MKAEKMDPVRAKAISIVLLHFWPLFCQRAVCHDSLSLSLPLSLSLSLHLSLSFVPLSLALFLFCCLPKSTANAMKGKSRTIARFLLSVSPPLPLALRNLLWKICIIHYAIMNVTMLLLPLSLSHLLFISFSAC